MAMLESVRAIVTHRFFRNHVVIVDDDELGRREMDAEVKKLIERKFQDRMGDNAERDNPIEINSVLVLGPRGLMRLTAEILENQAHFQTAPHGNRLTASEYLHYERGTRGPGPAAQKRATNLGKRTFWYGVAAVTSEHGAQFKIKPPRRRGVNSPAAATVVEWPLAKSPSFTINPDAL